MKHQFFIVFVVGLQSCFAQFGDAYHAANNAEIYRQQSRDLQNTLNTIRTNMYSKSATPTYTNNGTTTIAEELKEIYKSIEWIWDKQKSNEYWEKKRVEEAKEQAARDDAFRVLYAQRFNEWYAKLLELNYQDLTAIEFANFHVVESAEMGEYQDFFVSGMTQKMFDAVLAYNDYFSKKGAATPDEKVQLLYKARIMGAMLMPEIVSLQKGAKDNTEREKFEKLELQIWPYVFGAFRKKGLKFDRGAAEYTPTQYDEARPEKQELMLFRFLELIDKYEEEGKVAAGNCRYGYNPLLLLFKKIINDSNYTVEFKIKLADAIFATPINHQVEAGPKSSRTPDDEKMIYALYWPVLQWASETRKSYLATLSEEKWDYILKNSTISKKAFKELIIRYYGPDFYKFHYKNL
ncbi:MAG: hypothetical protein RLZZ500_1183 [Bacteroidota bacterium]